MTPGSCALCPGGYKSQLYGGPCRGLRDLCAPSFPFSHPDHRTIFRCGDHSGVGGERGGRGGRFSHYLRQWRNPLATRKTQPLAGVTKGRWTNKIEMSQSCESTNINIFVFIIINVVVGQQHTCPVKMFHFNYKLSAWVSFKDGTIKWNSHGYIVALQGTLQCEIQSITCLISLRRKCVPKYDLWTPYRGFQRQEEDILQGVLWQVKWCMHRTF